MLISVPLVYNLLIIKMVLKSLEVSSGLKVNFSKSSIFILNGSKSFLELTGECLYFKMDTLPFKYLGLLVDEPEEEMNLGSSSYICL